jgi:hypothetical protein
MGLKEILPKLDSKEFTARLRKDKRKLKGESIIKYELIPKTMNENEDDDLVWYAAYGSNLYKKRFLRYISKCNNKTPPLEGKPFSIPHKMYFAKHSSRWKDGGVAFIESRNSINEDNVLGKIYLIRRDQFIEIFHQENSKKTYDIFQINFERAIHDNQIIVPGTGWYRRIIYLGNDSGHPIFTFTGFWDDGTEELVQPSINYQRYIISGLRETYPAINLHSICYYLYKMGGTNNYEKEVTTRKDHECYICRGIIQKGEKAIVHRYFVDWNRTVSNYYHKNCHP